MNTSEIKVGDMVVLTEAGIAYYRSHSCNYMVDKWPWPGIVSKTRHMSNDLAYYPYPLPNTSWVKIEPEHFEHADIFHDQYEYI